MSPTPSHPPAPISAEAGADGQQTHYRPFRNGDVPALTGIWNAALPEEGVARPLNAHEFDELVFSRIDFDARGLIVAERGGRPIGFAHAGFGPEHPEGPSHRLDHGLGTIAMLAVDPRMGDKAVEDGLIAHAEKYLRSNGSEVFYAGGRYPLNPFYWGLYGGSEFSGVLDQHLQFSGAIRRAGYRPSVTSILLEIDLAAVPEVRDPRSFLIRRQTRLEAIEDCELARWWDALALGPNHTTTLVLMDRRGEELAWAATWEMVGFERVDGRNRLGLIGLEVDSEHRRRGLGRYLVAEVLRFARGQMARVVAAQTDANNLPALALYESLGFRRVGQSTLYRRPESVPSAPERGSGSRSCSSLRPG